MMPHLTTLGDAALILPASLVFAIYLFWIGLPRVALTWGLTILASSVATALLKISFYACGAKLPALGIISPSGHTSLAVTFYGCCVVIIRANEAPGWQRATLSAGSVVVICVVAVSRVLLHAHTVAEVALGLVIGIGCVVWFALQNADLRSPALRWGLALALLVVLILGASGLHFSLEGAFSRWAHLLRRATEVCS